MYTPPALLNYVKCSLDRKHEGCYTKVALPLFENEKIIEQPLDTWSLKDRYATAAVQQIFTARYICFLSNLDSNMSSSPSQTEWPLVTNIYVYTYFQLVMEFLEYHGIVKGQFQRLKIMKFYIFLSKSLNISDF